MDCVTRIGPLPGSDARSLWSVPGALNFSSQTGPEPRREFLGEVRQNQDCHQTYHVALGTVVVETTCDAGGCTPKRKLNAH